MQYWTEQSIPKIETKQELEHRLKCSKNVEIMFKIDSDDVPISVPVQF
jgi:hypothetical protein